MLWFSFIDYIVVISDVGPLNMVKVHEVKVFKNIAYILKDSAKFFIECSVCNFTSTKVRFFSHK